MSKILSLRPHGLCYGLSAIWFSSLFARWHYLADLASHFVLQYAIVATLLCLFLWWLNAPAWMTVAMGGIGLVCWLHLAALLLPTPVVYAKVSEDITILQFNVNYANPRADRIAGWINNYAVIDKSIRRLTYHTQPDIVVLQEVSPEVAENLTALEKTYPYKILAPKPGAFGVAIFSRIPIWRSSRKQFPGSRNEYTEVLLSTLAEGISFTLTELHTKPPLGKALSEERNQALEHIAQVVNRQPNARKILVGDMNITPYSPWFRDLQRTTKLTNTMQGKSIKGTWPSFLPSFLRIPIDHMLVSSNIKVLKRTVEGNFDSDHLPVITTLRLYQEK